MKGFGAFETQREAGSEHRLCTVQGREVLFEAAEEAACLRKAEDEP